MLNRALADLGLIGLLVLLCWVYSGPPPRRYQPATQTDLPRVLPGRAMGALSQQRAHELAWSGKRLYHCPGCRCAQGRDVDTMSAGI